MNIVYVYEYVILKYIFTLQTPFFIYKLINLKLKHTWIKVVLNYFWKQLSLGINNSNKIPKLFHCQSDYNTTIFFSTKKNIFVWHFINEHFTIINEHLTIISLNYTIIRSFDHHWEAAPTERWRSLCSYEYGTPPYERLNC